MAPTMRDLLSLLEESARTMLNEVDNMTVYATVFGKPVKVIKNPDEAVFMNKVGYGLRGTIDSDGNLWVWDAHEAIHQSVEDSLKLSSKYRFMMYSDRIATEYPKDRPALRKNTKIKQAYGKYSYSIVIDRVG